MDRKIIFLGVMTLASLSFFTVSMTQALFIDTATVSGNTFTATSEFPITSIANHVVISEVQINGATANQDFVELYNPTNSSIQITGWKLRTRNSAGTESSLAVIPSASIPAHGYYLWANDQSGYATSIGANTSNSNNVSPNNSIALLTNLDNVVDMLTWGTGINQLVEASPSANPTSGSLERKAYSTSTASTMVGSDAIKGNSHDTNNNLVDFILRTTSQPQNSSSSVEIP